jgi:H+/Cl- antiporter ClcA
MNLRSLFVNVALLANALKWTLLLIVVAVLAGSASALFLLGLDWATSTREANRWLLWGLPFAGFAVGWIYLKLGRQVEAGNNLLIDEIHDPKKVVPLRMAPLVLVGTVVSHLFGASVGREGTAVQMGGALADQLTPLFKLKHEDRRVLLMAGISAGFASVFGTPLAGAVFALEVLASGRMRYQALLPCVIAAVLADQVGLWWGVQHTVYVMGSVPQITPWLLLAMVLAGVAFGWVGRTFAVCTHALSTWMKQRVAYAPLRPMLGGAAVAGAVLIFGADRYMGLGIPVMQEAFTQPLPATDFLGKMAFTIASLGAGFKGGEVTPLFFIGATLGNALAPLLNAPFALLAAVGFVAVFAGAANVPLASTLMAMELFGVDVGVFAALACATSYMCSGQTGIYRSQQAGHAKLPTT